LCSAPTANVRAALVLTGFLGHLFETPALVCSAALG
jgi:hypothetical protein